MAKNKKNEAGLIFSEPGPVVFAFILLINQHKSKPGFIIN